MIDDGRTDGLRFGYLGVTFDDGGLRRDGMAVE